jgi:hypothetical protein
MERRDFLKLASLAGLSVVSGGMVAKANAFDPKSQTLWLMINASGGWDPTSLIDPKGLETGLNKYPQGAIRNAGNIRWAPMDQSPDVQQQGIDTAPIDAFFNDFYQDLLVLNGVDTATNSHDVGSRNTWSGGLMEGRATLSALIAASQAPGSPMAFITNGGYDFTGGIIGATRTGNIDAIIDIAYPNRAYIDDEGVETTFHNPRTVAMIQEARRTRYEALKGKQRLPRVKSSMDRLYMSRLGQNELAQLTAFLPEDLEDGMAGQAQLAFAAYQAGPVRRGEPQRAGRGTTRTATTTPSRPATTWSSSRSSAGSSSSPTRRASGRTSRSSAAPTSVGRPATTTATARTTGRSPA